MIPDQIQKMLKTPGVYIVSGFTGTFTVVHVSPNGTCQQMGLDGILSREGWHADVEVRGPLTMEHPTLGDTLS